MKIMNDHSFDLVTNRSECSLKEIRWLRVINSGEDPWHVQCKRITKAFVLTLWAIATGMLLQVLGFSNIGWSIITISFFGAAYFIQRTLDDRADIKAALVQWPELVKTNAELCAKIHVEPDMDLPNQLRQARRHLQLLADAVVTNPVTNPSETDDGLMKAYSAQYDLVQAHFGPDHFGAGGKEHGRFLSQSRLDVDCARAMGMTFQEFRKCKD